METNTGERQHLHCTLNNQHTTWTTSSTTDSLLVHKYASHKHAQWSIESSKHAQQSYTRYINNTRDTHINTRDAPNDSLSPYPPPSARAPPNKTIAELQQVTPAKRQRNPATTGDPRHLPGKPARRNNKYHNISKTYYLATQFNDNITLHISTH